jgi:hypothetical protein
VSDQLDLSQFLGLLVAILAAARLFGALAQKTGQPAVLGELVAGVVLGGSVLEIVELKTEVLDLFSELGLPHQQLPDINAIQHEQHAPLPAVNPAAREHEWE